jgi:hypothetical protein
MYKLRTFNSAVTEAGVAVTSLQGPCPQGFSAMGQSCYRYFPANGAAGSWSQAKQVCQQNGARLVEINDVYEDGFVQSLVGNQAPKGYWIGLADQTVSTENRCWIGVGDQTVST